MSQIESIQTNWYVLTGAPSSGKTKTLEYLAFLGKPIIPEAARVLIDCEMSRGRTIEQIRSNEGAFQSQIWQMKLEAEERINPSQLTFFDRGLPDTIAYSILNNQEFSTADEIMNRHRYRGIFLLEPLEFQQDYARIENRDFGLRLHTLLKSTYEDLEYPVITVPPMPIDRRAKFIIDRISIV